MSRPSRRRFLRGTGAAAGGLAAHALGGAASAGAQDLGGSTPGARLRRLLARPEPSRCVNCGDVATARLVEMHGFEMAMTGGSALSLSQFGIGDYGMATIDDLIDFCRRAADAVGLPIVADADDGGGNPLNVYRTMQRYERAGAACVMIEDLYGAKHLRGLGEGKILAAGAMVDKIHAAADARRGDTVLLARCDVVAAGGPVEEALERIARYAEEGGDLIFIPSLPLDQCARAVETAGRPMLASVPSLRDAQANRVSVAFFGGLNLVALGAVDRALGALARDGRVGRAGGAALDPGRRWELVRSDDVVERARRYDAQSAETQ